MELDAAMSPDAVIAALDPAVRRLVDINTTMYQGQWDDFEEDLRRRQAGRPYLFRMSDEPADVVQWVRRLRDYERARGESLAEATTATEERR